MLVFTYWYRKNKSNQVIPRSPFYLLSVVLASSPRGSRVQRSLLRHQHSAHTNKFPFLLEAVSSFVQWVQELRPRLFLRASKINAGKPSEIYGAPDKYRGFLLLSLVVFWHFPNTNDIIQNNLHPPLQNQRVGGGNCRKWINTGKLLF